MPDPRDLCTLADVKLIMQKSGQSAAAQDALIQAEITRASEVVMQDLGREFVPGGSEQVASTGATRLFEFEWSYDDDENFVDLYPYDLQISGPTAVSLDPDTDSPTTLTTDQFRPWPVPPVQGVYMALRLHNLTATPGSGWRTRQASVTGNWGFPSVPARVIQATAEIVIHWITAYPAARRLDQMDASVAPVLPRSMPMTAVDLLSRYARGAV